MTNRDNTQNNTQNCQQAAHYDLCSFNNNDGRRRQRRSKQTMLLEPNSTGTSTDTFTVGGSLKNLSKHYRKQQQQQQQSSY
jgi:hypothetical protein